MATARTASKDEESLAVLYDTLDLLRRSPDPFAPVHKARWRWLDGWLRARHPQDAAGARDDVLQETLLAIGRNVRRMDATTPAAAAKWAFTILERKEVDAVRVAARARQRDAGTAGEEELGALEAPRPPPPEGWLEDRLERIEEVVLGHIELVVPDPLVRVTRRAQARAALYRLVHELDIDEVDARLRLPPPGITPSTLSKWIERGRSIVASAMRAWADAHPGHPEIPEIATVVVEVIETRRADAGKPRPERRNDGSGS